MTKANHNGGQKMFDWKEYKKALKKARQRHRIARNLNELQQKVYKALQQVSAEIELEAFTDVEVEELLQALFRKYTNVTVSRRVLREKEVLYSMGKEKIPVGITVGEATVEVVVQSSGKPVLLRAKAKRLED